jgi:hypothetical protein
VNVPKRRLIAAAVSTLSAVAFLAPVEAGAAPPSPAKPAGHIGGIVPPHNAAKNGSSPFRSSTNNLSYHGGPVMQTNTVYAIYWVPAGYTVSTNYEADVNRFFGDVAAAQNATSNVYGIDTQYSGISNQSTFGGYLVDTSNLPPSGCRDNYTSVCLSDSQITTEIANDVGSKGWSNGSPTVSSTSLFLLFTANGIGSCSGSSCAFSQYCAYHGDLGNGATYANMPYADTVAAACDSGQYPNGDPAADSEINLITHEHNETITDENLNAWYDQRGYEIGDKCAWNFGSALGSTSYGSYNQVINGHDYYVQQEWSNKSSGCALHM